MQFKGTKNYISTEDLIGNEIMAADSVLLLKALAISSLSILTT